MAGDKHEAFERWQALTAAEGHEVIEPVLSPGGTTYEPIYFGSDATTEVPGAEPFTRGPYASMYRGRTWTLRQYAGFSTAQETNAFFKHSLSKGQRGLSVAFDLATHRGYDSDNPRVVGDVGMAGVAIDSADDMSQLFDGVLLSDVSVSMTMNGAVLPVLAAFIVAAERQGVSRRDLRGTIQNDILKEFIVRNTFIYPPAASMRIVVDVMDFVGREMPRFNSISVSGYHFEEAGAPPEMELAYTLADAVEYMTAAQARGIDVAKLLPRVSFFFGIGMQFFLEVAKLRAARRLWTKLVRSRFGVTDPEALRLRMHCQTSGVSLTAAEPLNNVARTTVEAMSAILGGTQSLHTNAFDEAWALPSDAAAHVARATQLILQHETDLTHTIDPLAGSYLVEKLTDDVQAAAERHIAEIDALGGMTRAIEAGVPQRRIAEMAALRQSRVDRERDVIVGVNRFRTDAGDSPSVRVIDNARVRQTQVESLRTLRERREEALVAATLVALQNGARGADNLLECSVNCVKAGATVGEVSDALAEVFGRHVPRFVTVGGVYGRGYTDTVEWQALTERVRAFERQQGRRPRLLVAKLGQDGHDRGAKVIASGFVDLGFDVDLGPLFQTPEEVARIAIDHDVHVVGISTQAGAHRSLIPELIEQLRQLGGQHVRVVCGGIVPECDREALEEAGVAAIFPPGTSVTDAAATVLDVLAATATSRA